MQAQEIVQAAEPEAPNPVYIDAAHKTAQALLEEFASYENYWRLGHSFDTLNDYFFAMAPSSQSEAFAKLALSKFLNRRSRPWVADEDKTRNPWWYDDFGWWALAALRASSRADRYGQTAELLGGVAELSWQPMYRGAPDVWRCAQWNPDWAGFEPRFDGGVWNYFFSEHEVCGIRYTPSQPGSNSLTCIQNTVTNGLFWVLMARLARQRKEEPALREAADAASGFFESWLGITDHETSLFYYFDKADPRKAVVRERVSTYRNGARVHGFDESLAWSGDQGLVLGALVDQMALVVDNLPSYNQLYAITQKLLLGVPGYLVDPSTKILWPWAPYSGPTTGCPDGDCSDYQTGVGVFMRYLLYAHLNNADVRKLLQQLDYQGLVRANADHVVSSPSTGLIGLTNDLATLVAALYMV